MESVKGKVSTKGKKMDVFDLEKMPVKQLRKVATDLNVEGVNRLKREGLIFQIARRMGEEEGVEVRGGVLEIMNEGIGFCGRITVLARMMCMSRKPNCVVTTYVLAIW